MAGRLFRLVYASRWANVLGEDIEAALHRIVAASIGRNRLADVTGLLLIHDGWFVQALEGPENQVRQLMEQIRTDPRHREVRVISATSAESRLFKDWNMAGARLGRESEAMLVELGQIARFDAARLDPVGALGLLIHAGEAERRREIAGLGLRHAG